ncbi:hypothetical protein ABBQ32_003024 [Trebouxia sp. C0010 RCD-2024]
MSFAMSCTRTFSSLHMSPSVCAPVRLMHRGLSSSLCTTTSTSLQRSQMTRTSARSPLHNMPFWHSYKTSNCSCCATATDHAKHDWEIKMLYDGDCPLCMREVNMLRKRDKDQNKIRFVDISSAEYSPDDNAGITYEQAMGTIHGILPGDKVITNVDVFRKLYETVGLGWVYAVTRFAPINSLANRIYAVWAKYRLPITGRPDIETVLRQKKETCRGSP